MAVARSLLTGRFAGSRARSGLHEPWRRPCADGQARTRRGEPAPSRPRTARGIELGAVAADRVGILPRRGAAGRAGGRGAGARPRPGRPAPRHQAVQPAARRRRPRLGHRLRAGQARGLRGPDPDRRHRRHPAVHGAGAVRGLVGPPQRHLRSGHDAVRDVDLASGVRCGDAGAG